MVNTRPTFLNNTWRDGSSSIDSIIYIDPSDPNYAGVGATYYVSLVPWQRGFSLGMTCADRRLGVLQPERFLYAARSDARPQRHHSAG